MEARTDTSDFHILAARGLRGIILKLAYISPSSAFQRVKLIGKRMLNMGHRSSHWASNPSCSFCSTPTATHMCPHPLCTFQLLVLMVNSETMVWSWNFVTDRSVHGRVDGQTKEPVMEARSDTDVQAKEPLVEAGSATVVQTKEPLMEARSDTDVQAKEPQMEARTDTDLQL